MCWTLRRSASSTYGLFCGGVKAFHDFPVGEKKKNGHIRLNNVFLKDLFGVFEIDQLQTNSLTITLVPTQHNYMVHYKYDGLYSHI